MGGLVSATWRPSDESLISLGFLGFSIPGLELGFFSCLGFGV